MSLVSLEICIDNPLSLHHAIEGGANRIELCQSLNTGGLTPSQGFIDWALKNTTVPLRIMIRQRGGNFCYSHDDMEALLLDVKSLPQHHMLEGIVVGILTEEGQIDCKNMQRMKDACGDLAVTCHRAFDHVLNAKQALKDLQTCGVDTLLTSGQKEKAIDAMELLADLSKNSGDIQIMTCGGFAPSFEEVQTLQTNCYSTWFHIAGAKTQNTNETGVNMGASEESDNLLITNVAIVKTVRGALDQV